MRKEVVWCDKCGVEISGFDYKVRAFAIESNGKRVVYDYCNSCLTKYADSFLTVMQQQELAKSVDPVAVSLSELVSKIDKMHEAVTALAKKEVVAEEIIKEVK